MKLTVEQVQEFYNNHPQQADSVNFDKNHSKPILRLIKDCLDIQGNDVAACLKKAEETIQKVKNKYTNKNTIRYYLQALLFLVDGYPGLAKAVPRAAYFKAWSASKLDTIGLAKEQKETIKAIPYDEIEKMVDAKYGADSMESLFIAFYKEVPLRLDFQDIMIGIPEADKNLDIKKKTVTMKTYNKTAEKYGEKVYNLSKELMKKIKASLKLNPRLQLINFANKNASKAISNLMVGAGIPGGSAMTLRHSLASANMTNEERVDLADKMAHSPATNLQYARVA